MFVICSSLPEDRMLAIEFPREYINHGCVLAYVGWWEKGGE